MNVLAYIKSWSWLALSVLAVLIGAYAAGGRAAKRSSTIKQTQQLNKASEHVRHVKESIDALDDTALHERSKRWVRNK